MKNQIITSGIVLTRTDFQEADRIVTLLTPDHGKLRVIAKGVRRPKSKLAGGIELFSISNITVLPGRGELGTLVSSRLLTHYGNIVKDIERTMLGYEMLKRIHRITEDAAGSEYFAMLQHALDGLNDLELMRELVDLWLNMQLLKETGHMPDLRQDAAGAQLASDKTYEFDYDAMAFRKQPKAPFTASHIKLMRLSYGTESPRVLKQVTGVSECAADTLKLVTGIMQQHLRV